MAQVCREIRVEYLPIYRAKHKLRIDFFDLDSYLEAWVTPPGTELEHVIGNLSINYNPELSIDYNPKEFDEQYERFDMIHLMQQADAARHLNVEFCFESLWLHEDDQPQVLDLLQKLLHASSMPNLDKFLREAMTAVELCCNICSEPQIYFQIKSGFEKPWMRTWSWPEDIREGYSDVDAWGFAMGLDITDVKYFITFGFEN